MTFGEYITEFAGKPVVDFAESFLEEKIKVLDSNVVYRISITHDLAENYTWTDLFSSFLNLPGAEKTSELIIGSWVEPFDNSPDPIIEALVTSRDKLPNLKALFIGDMTGEDCEVSWIIQSNPTPILKAFPSMEYFGIRGSTGLSLTGISSESLKTLIIQSGGLNSTIVKDVLNENLPAIEHLELWLGTEDYGGNSQIDDLTLLLEDKLFPNLKYLGLRNSTIANELAKELSSSPLLDRLDVLDLSNGILTDEGAQELLKSSKIKKLKKLDLHFHYCSDEMMKKLKSLEKDNDIQVNVSDQQEDDEDEDETYRYVAVSE